MKIALRHIQNNCVLCHANKLKDVDPMGECLPIMRKFALCMPVAFILLLAGHIILCQMYKQKGNMFDFPIFHNNNLLTLKGRTIFVYQIRNVFLLKCQ